MIPPPSDIATEANYNAVSLFCWDRAKGLTAHTQHHAIQLPGVTNELESARNALKDLNLRQSVAEGRQEFESVTQSITNSTDEIISSEWN